MSLKDKINKLAGESPAQKAKRRNAVILVLSVNGMNLATSLDKIRSKTKTDPKYATVYGNVLSVWSKMGGKPTDLVKSIEIGRNKKPLNLDFFTKTKKSGSSSAEGDDKKKINFETILNALDTLAVFKEMTKGVEEGKEIKPPPTPPKPDVKILGMNPWLAGGLFLTVIVGGGVFIYKRLN